MGLHFFHWISINKCNSLSQAYFSNRFEKDWWRTDTAGKNEDSSVGKSELIRFLNCLLLRTQLHLTWLAQGKNYWWLRIGLIDLIQVSGWELLESAQCCFVGDIWIWRERCKKKKKLCLNKQYNNPWLK